MTNVSDAHASVPSVTERTVREKPILFSAPMVKALLDGRKTQTRRVATKLNPAYLDRHCDATRCTEWRANRAAAVKLWSPYGQPGDRLAFRPTEAGWYDVRWEPGDSWERVWLFDGGDTWGWSPTDDPEGVELDIREPARTEWKRPGDRLWVRESGWLYGRWYEDGVTSSGRTRWRFDAFGQRAVFERPLDHELTYRGSISPGYAFRPSIHMPRWASRITLEITDVRVERVQDISEADAQAEGAEYSREIDYSRGITYSTAFRELWDSINASRGYGWDVNSWVWAITFKRLDAPSLDHPHERLGDER